MLELGRRHVDDGIRHKFSPWAQLDPLNLDTATVGAYASGRNHHMLAPDSSDCHQLALGAVMVESLDSRVWKLARVLASLQNMDHRRSS